MPLVQLGDILPALQTLKATLSAQGDIITINIKDKDFYISAYDKAREIQIYAKFPGTCDGTEDLKFTISLDRFKTLLQRQTKMELKFGKSGLHYGNKNVSGTIEAGLGEIISYPVLDTGKAKVNKTLYEWIKIVKLNTLFKKEDMLVFVEWDQEEDLLLVACADNFHTALLTVLSKDKPKALESFSIALPVRYIEIANRLMVEEGVGVSLQEDTTLFYNQNMVLKVPTVNVDGEQVNIKAIQDFTGKAQGKRSDLTRFDRSDKIKTFLHQAKAYLEEDRDSKVQLRLKEGRLRLFTETKHGNIEAYKQVEGKANTRITVNTRALTDLVSKIGDDRSVYMAIAPQALYLRYSTETYEVQLTTLGTTDDS